MAKIKELPGLAIVNGLKGKLDFYYWKGIACCRAWPRSPGKVRAPAVMAQWLPFAYAAQAWNLLSPDLRSVYRANATSTNLSDRDMFIKNYLSSGSFVRI